MGSSYSKLFRTIPYSCYELGHTWNPSCTGATVEVGLICLEEALKIYTTVYTFSLLLRGRVPSQATLVTLLKNIIRSSAFLSYNAFYFVWAFCSFRKLIYNHNYYTFGLLSAWIASFLAIFVERPHRRSLLATYVCNVATESLISSGGFPRIPNGESVVFGLVSSVLLYLYRKRPSSRADNIDGLGNNKDFIFGIIRFLIGKPEEGSAALVYSPLHSSGLSLQKVAGYCSQFPASVKNILLCCGRPKCCPHQDEPCLLYAFKGFMVPMILATAGQFGLSVVKKKHSTNARPGLFLGAFVGLFKLLTCLTRSIMNEDAAEAAIPIGFIAGFFSSLLYPSLSLSIYALWKTAEILCRKGVTTGKMAKIPFATELLYATGTSILFHLAVARPHHLKPSYFKFMNRITGNRVGEINRFLLDHEYPGLSEATKVYRHLPQYVEDKLTSPHMLRILKEIQKTG